LKETQNAAAAMPAADAVKVRGAPGSQDEPIEASAAVATFESDPFPNTDEALAFLAQLDPAGRHDLVAIDPDLPDGHRDKIKCATFLPGDHEKMQMWIEAQQGKKNLYTSVNRAKDEAPHNRRLNHKKRNEIGWLRAITPDIDTKKIPDGDASGENFRREANRLLQEVAPSLSSSQCPPTVLVYSGGGLQPWFVLETPLPATSENVALVEGIGRTLKNRYGGDSVFDAARIMRLPGTINIPDARKQAQGRRPALATILIEHSTPRKYVIEELETWAPPTPESSRSSALATSKNPKSSGSIPVVNIDMRQSKTASGDTTRICPRTCAADSRRFAQTQRLRRFGKMAMSPRKGTVLRTSRDQVGSFG
jgi:hypothetical protein